MSLIKISHVSFGIPQKKVRALTWTTSASVLPTSPAPIYFTSEDLINNHLEKESNNSSVIFALSVNTLVSEGNGERSRSFVIVHFKLLHFRPVQHLTKIIVQYPKFNINKNNEYKKEDQNNQQNNEIEECMISSNDSKKFETLVHVTIPAISLIIESAYHDSCSIQPSSQSLNEKNTQKDMKTLRNALKHKPYLVVVLRDGILFFVEDGVHVYLSILMSNLSISPTRWLSCTQVLTESVDINCSSLELMSQLSTSTSSFQPKHLYSLTYKQLIVWVTSICSNSNGGKGLSNSSKRFWPFRKSNSLYPEPSFDASNGGASSSGGDIGAGGGGGGSKLGTSYAEASAILNTKSILLDDESSLNSTTRTMPITCRDGESTERSTTNINIVSSSSSTSSRSSSTTTGGGGGGRGGSVIKSGRGEKGGLNVSSSSLDPMDLSTALHEGVLDTTKLSELLESSFGLLGSIDTHMEEQKQSLIRFWSAIYGYATGDNEKLENTLAVLKAVLIALKWPSLCRSFISSGGPFWLSWLHMALPGCPSPSGLPEEAQLDVQLQQINEPMSSSASSSYRSSAITSERDKGGGVGGGSDPMSPLSRNMQGLLSFPEEQPSSSTLPSSCQAGTAQSIRIMSSSSKHIEEERKEGNAAAGDNNDDDEEEEENRRVKGHDQEKEEDNDYEEMMKMMQGTWALLECEEEENLTWRLDAVEEAPSHMECTSPAPPALWSSRQSDSVFNSMAAATERRLNRPINNPHNLSDVNTAGAGAATGAGGTGGRGGLETLDSQNSTARDVLSVEIPTSLEEQQDQLMAALCGTPMGNDGNNVTHSIIPKLPLGFLPLNRLSVAPATQPQQHSTRHTSILVGSLMRGGKQQQQQQQQSLLSSSSSSEDEINVNKFIANGGGIDIFTALDNVDRPIDIPDASQDIEQLICNIFHYLLSDSYETTTVEAASVFLCTVKGRAYRTDAILSKHVCQLEEMVSERLFGPSTSSSSSTSTSTSEWKIDSKRQELSRRESAGLLGGKQLANRCEAIVSVERKISALQRARCALWVTPSERRWWVQQLCACGVERGLYTLLLKDVVKSSLNIRSSNHHKEDNVSKSNNSSSSASSSSSIQHPPSKNKILDILHNDLSKWVKVCCDILSPLHETRSRSTFAMAHLHGSSIHVVISILDLIFQVAKGEDIKSLLYEMSEAETAIAVIVAHLEWLLSSFGDFTINVSNISESRKLNAVNGPLKPLPLSILNEYRIVGLRFLRKLTECCACACAFSSTSCAALSSRSILRYFEVEGLDEILFRMLEAWKVSIEYQEKEEKGEQEQEESSVALSRATTPLSSTTRNRSIIPNVKKEVVTCWRSEELSLLNDVLSCLTAAHSDRRRLSRSGCRLLEPILTLLVTLITKPEKSIVKEEEEVKGKEHKGQVSPSVLLCRCCLQLLVVVAGARGVREAEVFHSTGVVSFLVYMLEAVNLDHKPLIDNDDDDGEDVRKDRENKENDTLGELLGTHSRSPSKAVVEALEQETKQQTVAVPVVEDIIFEVGQRVRGRWLIDEKERWFPGNIVSRESDGSYTVKYDDGDQETKKLAKDLKPLRKLKPRALFIPKARTPPKAQTPPPKTHTPPRAASNLVVDINNDNGNDESPTSFGSCSSPLGLIPPSSSNTPKTPTSASGFGGRRTSQRRQSTGGSFDSSVGVSIFSDSGDDDMFVSIPSSLPNKKSPSSTTTSNNGLTIPSTLMMGLDLASMNNDWAIGGDHRFMDQSTGFSSLVGFGMKNLKQNNDENKNGNDSDVDGHDQKKIDQKNRNPLLSILANDLKCHELILSTLLLLTLAPDGRRLEKSATLLISKSWINQKQKDKDSSPTSSSPSSSFFSMCDFNMKTKNRHYDLISFLHQHLSSKVSKSVTPLLHTRCQNPSSLGWLLRLLSPQLLNTDAYQINVKNNDEDNEIGTEKNAIENHSNTTVTTAAAAVQNVVDDNEEPRNLGQGSFGRVVSVACLGACLGGPRRVAIKMCRSSARSVFEEVVALRLCSGLYGPKLIDLGYCLKNEEFWLVMEQCAGSLKQWRGNIKKRSINPTSLDVFYYLHIFRGVTKAVCGLTESAIIHFDLKCDNILIREGSENENIPSVCIGDFGEACVVEASNAATGVRIQRARGTECVQSPEMLLVQSFGDNEDMAATSTTPPPPNVPLMTMNPLDSVNNKSSNRGSVTSSESGGGSGSIDNNNNNTTPTTKRNPVRSSLGYRREYVSCVSDIWSLGCLLFELLSNDYLYNVSANEGGWSRLFVLLTKDDGELFLQRKLDQIRSFPYSNVIEQLIRALLVRNPDHRPSAFETLRLVDEAIFKISIDFPEESKQINSSSSLTKPHRLSNEPSFSSTSSLALTPSHNNNELKQESFLWQLNPSLMIAHQGIKKEEDDDSSKVNMVNDKDKMIIIKKELQDEEQEKDSLEKCSFPYAWIDDTINFSNSKFDLDQVHYLGITHLVHVKNQKSSSSSIQTSSSSSSSLCTVCDTLCDSCSRFDVILIKNNSLIQETSSSVTTITTNNSLMTEKDIPSHPIDLSSKEGKITEKKIGVLKQVDFEALSKTVHWIILAIESGGRVLITSDWSELKHNEETQNEEEEEDDVNNMGAALIGIATLMIQRKCSLFDALVKLKSSNAAFSLDPDFMKQLLAWSKLGHDDKDKEIEERSD